MNLGRSVRTMVDLADRILRENGKTTADVDEIVKTTYDLMQKALDEVNAEAKRLNNL